MPVLAPLQADRSAPPRLGEDHRAAPWLVQVGLIASAIAYVLDQATKHLAESVLVRSRFEPWLSERFGWQLTYNDGGAFGFPAPSLFFLIVTVVVAVIVIRNLPIVRGPGQAVAYGLLLAGALGNATDRVLRLGDPGDPRYLHGHVIDFVAWGTFPRFNIADVSITIGFVLLIASLWMEERRLDEVGG